MQIAEGVGKRSTRKRYIYRRYNVPEFVGSRDDRWASPCATKPLAQHRNEALCGVACIALFDAAEIKRFPFLLGDVVLV